ncbi:meiosis protein mei2 [Stemphylium lycopersici]|nr:meiosis protein mei2 [Stemphylium lycopersici]
MSHTSPHSSTGHGPSSSPYAGTDPTLYSPEIDRKPHLGHRRQITAIAAGKQPVKEASDKPANIKTILPHPAIYVEGAYINELSEDDEGYVSRYQFISQLPDGTNAGLDSEHELFSVQHQMKLYACFLNAVPYYARGVFIRYDDLRDAAEGKDILEQHEFTVDYATSYDYARAKTQDTGSIKEFEGQIKLFVMIEPNRDQAAWDFSSDDLAGVTNVVKLTAQAFGDVRNVTHADSIEDKMLLVFRIEFCSVDTAIRAVQSLRIDPVWGVSGDKSFQWCTFEPSLWSGARAAASPHRYKPRIDAQGRVYGYRLAPTHQMPDQYTDRRASYHSHPHDQHNRVRRERILDGSDVRTTVMLRNIPNKLDWMSLKNILDEVCFGTYDFMYLRIDFKSGCNVGYAFINFSDANGMLSLIDRIERRLWPGFNSDKTAEISYATIQGREALVQKFRNSSVMQETPYCRPRLVFTLVDAEMMGQLRTAGTEQAFPRPDNLSKLQRSMDSARSIGLYPPNGCSPVTEHRNRSSAYDRGGPRDIMQAAMHFAHQRAAPVQFAGLADAKKKEIETWYLCTYGGGHCGRIPFECIPMTHVTQYFNENPAPMPAPGVIGAPVSSPFASGVSSTIPDGTPTRASRMARGPIRPFSARGDVDTNTNPFL